MSVGWSGRKIEIWLRIPRKSSSEVLQELTLCQRNLDD